MKRILMQLGQLTDRKKFLYLDLQGFFYKGWQFGFINLHAKVLYFK
jgi:hypothetical protein